MLADRVRLGVQEKGGMVCELIDRTTPTVVVNQPYSTEGNGGRKLVGLSNGWLVAGLVNGQNLVLRCSKNYGATWSEQNRSIGGNLKISLVSNRNYVVAVCGITGIINAYVYGVVNDSLQLISSISIVTNEGTINNISTAINKEGTELHACWSSKKSTYPDSFNIRYCKGTINVDSTVTWGSVEQITKYNQSGFDHIDPTIIVDNDNYYHILYNFSSLNVNMILDLSPKYTSQDYPSSALPNNKIVAGGQSTIKLKSPSACVDKDGTTYAVWVNGTFFAVSKSLNGGTSWSSYVQLPGINGGSLISSSICVNKNNKVFVHYGSSTSTIQTSSEDKGTTWVYDGIILLNTQFRSLLDDNTLDFERPLGIYTTISSHTTNPSSVIFSGKWYECKPKPTKPDDPLKSIGNQYLIAGDMQAGYFGTVNGLVTNTQLTNLMGMTAGTLLDPADTDITFHKFAHKGRILLIPNRPIKRTISWDNIQSQNGVKGKVISIDANMYLCRLMTGSRHYYTGNNSIAGGEWEDLFVRFHTSSGGILTDADIPIGKINICQEVHSDNITYRVARGQIRVSSLTQLGSSAASSNTTWLPILEVL